MTSSPHLTARRISARSYPFKIVGPFIAIISSSELGPTISVSIRLEACLMALKCPE